jgi:predicted dinucleotide-binding enzyme
MKIAVLGTGMVGRAIASRLVELGHETMMGSRTADNPSATAWASDAGALATHGTFADAAAFGEIVWNCTSGAASIDALTAAGAEALGVKVLIDVANPLDHSRGFPPTLFVSNTDSLAEQIQRAFPTVRVVKTLNTMGCDIMVSPVTVPGDHVVFVSGDDADAKESVTQILLAFGWPPARVVDLGGIETARGPEQYLPLWLRMAGALGTGAFNIAIDRGPA